MAEDRLDEQLQRSVLAVLCFDDTHGAAVATQVIPTHFDTVYQQFAARVLSYRKRYGGPPGQQHIDDLAARSAPGRDKDAVLVQLLPELKAIGTDINAEYVSSRTHTFVRQQTLKAALFEAGDRWDSADDRLVPDVEAILSRALKHKSSALSVGLRLGDPRALSFVEKPQEFVSLGMPVLDAAGIGLVPKELLLLIAPKASGKTWFCVYCGKMSLLQRKKVLHVTLEYSEEKTIRRYHQALFAVARSRDKFYRSELELDDRGEVTGFTRKKVGPQNAFTDLGIRKILLNKMRRYGTRLDNNLIVKEFATSTLTMDQLVGYLDYLEGAEDFVPDVLIVDYPKLMKLNARGDDLRIKLGQAVEELRGLAVLRNVAVVAPHQGTRSSIGARQVRSNMAGEDISVVQTADTVLALSRTRIEEEYGLARLSVEHVRDSAGGMMLLLSQSYPTGQFVVSSAPIANEYWTRLRELVGDDGEEE